MTVADWATLATLVFSTATLVLVSTENVRLRRWVRRLEDEEERR